MIFQIFNIIAPVFLLIGAGYGAVKAGLFGDELLDGLNGFAIKFAIPCLLFSASSTLDLHSAYDWRVMLSFYSGATLSFGTGIFMALKLFNRSPGEAVAVGFGALFSNLVLLGLPISGLAYGTDSLGVNYAIISVHAPFCYLLGITAIELLRADGRSLAATARVVGKAMFRNSLMIGLGLGFVVNLSGLALPGAVLSVVAMMKQAALPAALFGLGGLLTRYSLSKNAGAAAAISCLSLGLHPLLTYLLCHWLGVPAAISRSAVLMAAMAPGLNVYLLAFMYNRAIDTAANTVIIGTAMSIFTVSAWLWVLG
ncbi:MAG: AEC family transporter [Hyphomicrobiales bacterium]|nr:MAG: AEC family transporter [Hyphomicrobiales bacterium]